MSDSYICYSDCPDCGGTGRNPSWANATPGKRRGVETVILSCWRCFCDPRSTLPDGTRATQPGDAGREGTS